MPLPRSPRPQDNQTSEERPQLSSFGYYRKEEVEQPPLVQEPAQNRVLPSRPTVGSNNASSPRTKQGYIQVGRIDTGPLLEPLEVDFEGNKLPNKYERLASVIEDYTSRLQDIIKDEGRTDDVTLARNGDETMRSEMGKFIDQNLLKLAAQDSKAPKGEDRQFFTAAVVNEILGLGPLEPLLQDKSITEIMVNGPYDVQVEIGGKIFRVPGVSFRNQAHLLEMCQKILSYSGRRVDLNQPITDGRLPDQSRVHVVHQIIAYGGPTLTIRRHREEAWTLRELLERDALNEDMLVDLALLIHSGCSTIVVGGTGTGKALALDTYIPTPQGAKTMGTLVVGDYVYDDLGLPTRVTHIFDHEQRKTYRLVFSTGTTVRADLDHNWFARFNNEEPSVYTTEQIMQRMSNEPDSRVYIPALMSPVRPMQDSTSVIDELDISQEFNFSTQTLDGTISTPSGVERTIKRSLGIIIEGIDENGSVEITSIDEPEVEDVRCITVASKSSLFLFSRDYLVTHNTTMLNALSGLFPLDDRIVTIEDNLELKIHPSRLVAPPMETRDASSSGSGAITIRDLVKASLRMRPNRIVVGEVRDSAALDMLQAMNTGHSGSMTTIHANDAETAIPRLEGMVSQSGEFDARGALSLIAGAVDILVIIERFPEDGSRRITGIYEVPSRISMETGEPELIPTPLWVYNHTDTDPETNKVIGHWEKVNEPSQILRRKHRLDRKKKMTVEEILQYIKD